MNTSLEILQPPRAHRRAAFSVASDTFTRHLGAPLQLHRRLHRFDALVSRSNGLGECGLEALIGRDQPRVLLIRHANRRFQ
jgi:hypothetical protein